MTAHAIRIKASLKQEDSPSTIPAPEPPELKNVVPDRVSQNVFDSIEEKLPEQASPISERKASEMTNFSVDHLHGVYRASKNTGKTELLDKVESGVVADAKWCKIEWHDCDHDEPDEERTGCGNWKTERTKGTVPEEV